MSTFIFKRISLLLGLFVAISVCNATSLTREPLRASAGVVQFAYDSYSVNESAGLASIALVRTGGSDGTVSVSYTTRNGTALEGQDYTGVSGTVVFGPGETSKTISIPIIDDNLNEDDETVFIDLIGDAVGLPNSATLTIIDNDPIPTISINNISVLEGDDGTTDAVFTVSLSAPSGRTIQVDYSTQDNTAIEGGDYFGVSGTLVIPAGESSGSITVQVIGDTQIEPNETFYVSLHRPINVSITNSQGVCTILDDDSLPARASISDASIVEGNSGTQMMVFNVTLTDNMVSGGINILYSTTSGTATSGTDFVATSGTLNIARGRLTGTISVPIIGDTMYEPDETFSLNIYSNVALFAPRQATGTIVNDDAVPTVSISDPSIAEGNVGTTTLVYTVSLSNPSYQPVTVSFATRAGTGATDGVDYIGQTGQLVFNPGEVTKTVSVVVNSNTTYEPTKVVYVDLSNPIDATMPGGTTQETGQGQILNDDPQMPVIAIGNVSVVETNKGYVDAVLPVTLSSASTQTVTVAYATANGTALAGQDYVAASGTVTFAPGTTSATITVKVKGDRKKESNETFSVNLSNPSNGLFGNSSSGVVTIVNDDGLPKLWISNASMKEGDGGSKPMQFAVRLQKNMLTTVTVSYATVNGTALAGRDYVAASGTLTFAPGETQKTISVSIIGDLLNEPDETFFVKLSNPSGAQIQDGSATGTIQNDDAKPVLSVSNVTVTEGNSGTTPAMFWIRLSAASGETVKVNYSTEDGTASSRSDYVSTSGALVFNPGETAKSVVVLVKGDVVPELDETFYVHLTGASNATICTARGTGTIKDDDARSIICQFTDLMAYIRSLSADVFRKPSENNRSDLLKSISGANCALQRGDLFSAQFGLKGVLNGLSDAGRNGWVTQDDCRKDLYKRASGIGIFDQSSSAYSKSEDVIQATEDVQTPTTFGLEQNYPNPFNPTTTIRYSLREPGMVSLKVYDVLGRVVADLVEELQVAGVHSVQFNADRLPSGTYVYRINAGSFSDTKKLLLMK
ncbi:MAG TPA: Calx-beta domain-containing protein [Bacteroidota bacterium]|nr:Calx-beta domain-containing protein [Bacteroidota bacterium]